ncbi:class I SAM-dependent methyltransferase [Acaryochloris marina]|uniref:Methyltransferase domain-containing protein n=1 Tax=Acaryochloris marina (strain MBIC 11017) TaxID=329726 RepID=B0BZG6_ACAM1|nr:class I SAM-dependent methyltransferase [Acaryochloris marina]ABW30711.1 hypothetical protein AM1_5766 [Acaryochloris marina MBIC11017]BDM79491.1 hypothetical protein AM10699_23590 [Acaryochloris marina MBIC10699]
MTNRFQHVRELYDQSYKLYGDSPASLLTPKGRSELRFRAIDPYLIRSNVRVLDYGCGLGYLYEYLNQSGFEVNYTGIDILPSFINACRDKYPDCANFHQIEPESNITGEYDVVFASGVFNLVSSKDEESSKSYAYNRIKHLFEITREVLVCDFLSPYVDFKQELAQHFSIDEIANLCSKSLTRRFMIRHDLLPYEFTLIAHQKSKIKRPENFFEVDANLSFKGEI